MLIADTVLHQIEPLLLASVGAFVYYFFNRKGHTGEALDFIEKANDLLTKENKALKEQNINKDAEIATLRASRDVSLAIRPVLEEIKELKAQQIRQHETFIGFLAMIADAMPKEN